MGLRLSRWGRPGGPEGGVAARALFLKAPRRRAAWVPAGEVVGERLRPSADLGGLLNSLLSSDRRVPQLRRGLGRARAMMSKIFPWLV